MCFPAAIKYFRASEQLAYTKVTYAKLLDDPQCASTPPKIKKKSTQFLYAVNRLIHTDSSVNLFKEWFLYFLCIGSSTLAEVNLKSWSSRKLLMPWTCCRAWLWLCGLWKLEGPSWLSSLSMWNSCRYRYWVLLLFFWMPSSAGWILTQPSENVQYSFLLFFDLREFVSLVIGGSSEKFLHMLSIKESSNRK